MITKTALLFSYMLACFFVHALRVFRTMKLLFLQKNCAFLNMVVTLYAQKVVCT